MAETGNNTPLSLDQEWMLIEGQMYKAAIEANGGNPLSPEQQAAIKNSVIYGRERNLLTQSQAQAVRKLFESRPEIALQTAKNVLDLGKKAGETEIGLQDKALTSAIQIGQLAGATDIEVQGITAKFYAGWVGPITMIGKLLNACGATEWGNKCIEFAQSIAPADIDDKRARARLYEEKRNVAIDEGKAAASQMSVWSSAVAFTVDEVARVDKKEKDAVDTTLRQSQTDKADAYVDKAGGKPKVGAPGKPDSAPSVSATSSTANIAALSAELVAFDKGKNGSMTERQVAAQVKSILSIDASSAGDKDGKPDQGAEKDAYLKSTAYLSLPDGEKKIMRMFYDEKVRDAAVAAAPAVGAPAPANN